MHHYVQNSSVFTLSDKLQLALVIASFLTIVVALLIATQQDKWRAKHKRSKIEYFGTASHMQGQDNLGSDYRLHYLRLLLKNLGYEAMNVETSVIKIEEEIREQISLRQNFLEVPLNWTHGVVYDPSGVVRNIQTNQTAYLDICSGPTDYQSLALCTGVTGNADFRDLNPGKTTLTLALFQKSGQTLYIV